MLAVDYYFMYVRLQPALHPWLYTILPCSVLHSIYNSVSCMRTLTRAFVSG